jgi:DHA1 family tetracycline resistance protein-like MFS transporter
MKRSPLLVIFFVVFIDLLAFGIVIPILPYYSKTFGANATTLGWLMASFSIAQFLFSPVWGGLSDRWGRKPILLVTILGGAICMAATALAGNLWILFLARIFGGIFGANISTASAYIADVTSPQDRAKGMGIIGAGYGLGFIFGPALGGILSTGGYHIPLLLGACLGLANFIFAYFILEESRRSSSAAAGKKFSREAFRIAISRDRTAIPIFLFFLSTFAFTQLEVVFGLFVLERFGYQARDAGWLLAGMGVVSAFLQGGMIGRLARRFGEVNLAITGFTLFFLFLGLAPTALEPRIFALYLLGVALGSGLVNPSLSSLVSKGASEDERGRVMGIYQSAGSLARIGGPPLAGILFDRVGSASPIFLSSIIMLGGLVVALVGRRRMA